MRRCVLAVVPRCPSTTETVNGWWCLPRSSARSLRLPPELAQATAEDITTAIRRDLAAVHGIRVSDVLLLRPGSLPFTSSGKLQRYACRAGYVEGRFAPSRALRGLREGDLGGVA